MDVDASETQGEKHRRHTMIIRNYWRLVPVANRHNFSYTTSVSLHTWFPLLLIEEPARKRTATFSSDLNCLSSDRRSEVNNPDSAPRVRLPPLLSHRPSTSCDFVASSKAILPLAYNICSIRLSYEIRSPRSLGWPQFRPRGHSSGPKPGLWGEQPVVAESA
jgi:hypothetical protein